MNRSTEVRLRKLERQNERPIDDWSNEELEAEIVLVVEQLVAVYGSVEAAAEAVGEPDEDGASILIDTYKRHHRAQPLH